MNQYTNSKAHRIKNPLRKTSEHNYRYNYLNLSFFQQNFLFLIDFKSFKIKVGYILIDFEVIFLMYFFVFAKSPNLGSNVKKKIITIFSPKN